jgi:hypothetical protein
MTTANLNSPCLVASGPLTGDELDRLQLRRAADRSMLAAVAAGIAMQTNCSVSCQKGRACDCVRDQADGDIEGRYRAAQAFADEPEDQSDSPSWRELIDEWGPGIAWGLLAVGLLAVLLR